jgi:hypothetical protein
MPQIDDDLKNRIKQHLGYNRPRGLSPALLQIFNQNCKQFQSNSDIYGTTGQSLTIIVARCDFAFRCTDVQDTAAVTQYQQILGDVIRSTRTFTLKEIMTSAEEKYMMECDKLAMFMGGIPNLQRPEVFSKYYSATDSYVQVSPEIPDTCVSDRLILSERYC